jgi:hypothetical protein
MVARALGDPDGFGAGVVEAVGPDVTVYQAGDEVYGATRGAFAEYAVASVDKIAPKPPQLSFERAAVLPSPTFVAMQALRAHGHVQPGQRVLLVIDYHRGLRRRLAPLRPGPRHRWPDVGGSPAPRAHPDRDPRHPGR